MPMLTTAQRAERRRGITATDVGAIIGRNPWKGPVDVWREKVHGAEAAPPGPKKEHDPRDWGNRLEQPIRDWYASAFEVEVSVPGVVWHRSDALACAMPDGLVHRIGTARALLGLEIKTHTTHLRHLYGAPGSDEVPLWELLQCVWGMYVTGIPEWNLVAYIDNTPLVYRITRDEELEALCVGAARDFWDRYVVTRTSPPPDGSASFAAELLRRFPRHASEQLVEASDADLEAVRELRSVREQLAELGRREATIEQQIKLSIGDASGLTWREGARTDKVTWRRAADSVSTDWEAVAVERSNTLELLQSAIPSVLRQAVVDGLLSSEALDRIEERLAVADLPTASEVIARSVKTIPGARRFCVPRAWAREQGD